MRGHGELLGIFFKLPGGIQHAFDNSANLGSEFFDKLIEFRLATVHRQSFSVDALSLELAAFEAVVFENTDRPSDRAYLVLTIDMIDLDVRPAVGKNSQRVC